MMIGKGLVFKVRRETWVIGVGVVWSRSEPGCLHLVVPGLRFSFGWG